MLCEVLKTITGPGGTQYLPGQQVDVSTWRWARKLVIQRKLRPVGAQSDSPSETEAEVAFTKRGRPRVKKD